MSRAGARVVHCARLGQESPASARIHGAPARRGPLGAARIFHGRYLGADSRGAGIAHGARAVRRSRGRVRTGHGRPGDPREARIVPGALADPDSGEARLVDDRSGDTSPAARRIARAGYSAGGSCAAPPFVQRSRNVVDLDFPSPLEPLTLVVAPQCAVRGRAVEPQVRAPGPGDLALRPLQQLGPEPPAAPRAPNGERMDVPRVRRPVAPRRQGRSTAAPASPRSRRPAEQRETARARRASPPGRAEMDRATGRSLSRAASAPPPRGCRRSRRRPSDRHA
jgi:hypothetical protein